MSTIGPTPEQPLRIAMWSGPRNISTALMRSWGNRPDTSVVDEPLYAHYLRATGLDHPGAEEVKAHHETDWQKVVAFLAGPVPGGRSIFYQKHMAHHLLPHIGRDWLSRLTHVFLIREPREMLTSLIKVLPSPRLEDTGLPQQVEIFQLIQGRFGTTPPVIDARDVLEQPKPMLERLCEQFNVPFTEAMLSWPPGRRETDGIWAKYWYGNVEQSTMFQPYKPKNEPVPNHLTNVLQECDRMYNNLYRHRLTV